MTNCTPWNIYAEQLFPVGYGYPLWYPELSEGYEVSIGDVGYMNEGRFWALFNSMHEETDAKNDPLRNRRVPRDYQKFNTEKALIRKEDKIVQNMVCSRNICNFEVQGDIGGGGVAANAGVGFKFQSTNDCGAFTVLVPPGHSEDIHSKRHIVDYMKGNFDSWMELANSDDFALDRKEDDLMFICGTTKTTQWGVAAFQGSVYREKGGYVSASLGSSATAQFSTNISNECLPASHYRFGPYGGWSPPTMSMIQYPGYDRPDAAPNRNQCIFIHYFKMKRRLWLFKEPMLAGAGLHELPPSGPHHPSTGTAMADAYSPVYELEPDRYPAQEQTYDPVNDLLDYILQESSAEVAIACDLDIIAIFQNEDFPQDIPAALVGAAPHIEVDERGVGTVSTSYDFQMRRAREDSGEDLTEPVPKRTKYSDDNLFDPALNAQFTMDTEFGAEYGIDGPFNDTTEPFPDHMPAISFPDPMPTVPSPYDTVLTAPFPYDTPTFPFPDYTPTSLLEAQGDEDDTTRMEPPRDKAAGKRPEHGSSSGAHSGSVTALAYSADGRYVVSGSQDSSIVIWDARGSIFLHKMPISPDVGHHEAVSALAFSRDNQLLASAATNEDIVLWSVANGRFYKQVHPDSSVHTLAYTPDGLHLIAGASDGRLYVWDTETYEQRTVLETHTAVINFIVFSPNGRYMAVGMEGMCFIWDTANLVSGEPISTLDNEYGMVYSAAFAPDNRRIITASDDGTSCIWNAETGERLVNLHEHSDFPVLTVAFSPDGKRVASGSSDSTVNVCDSFDGSRLLSLDEHDGTINVVRFSPDGKYIATAASDSMVHLWDARDGTLIRKYNEHNDDVTYMMFSSDGTTLASGSSDGTLYIRHLTLEG